MNDPNTLTRLLTKHFHKHSRGLPGVGLCLGLAVNGAGNYAVAWFDHDNNGFLDAYVFNGFDADDGWTANQLYSNNGNQNAWLTGPVAAARHYRRWPRQWRPPVRPLRVG
jgi:hypothetical protein